MLFELTFEARMRRTTEVEAADLDEAISQSGPIDAPEDLAWTGDDEDDLDWTFVRAAVDGQIVEEAPKLHDQADDTERELARLREQLSEAQALLGAATEFRVTGPAGMAIVAQEGGIWQTFHPQAGRGGWASYVDCESAVRLARELTGATPRQGTDASGSGVADEALAALRERIALTAAELSEGASPAEIYEEVMAVPLHAS